MAIRTGSAWFGVFGSYYTAIRDIGEGVSDQKRVASNFLNLLIGQIMSVADFYHVGYQSFVHLLI